MSYAGTLWSTFSLSVVKHKYPLWLVSSNFCAKAPMDVCVDFNLSSRASCGLTK